MAPGRPRQHMVTEVRQRVTRDQLGRRGRNGDPAWVNHKLLLSGAENPSTKQWRRFTTMLDTADPTGEIGAAWASRNASACCSPNTNQAASDEGWPTSTNPRSTPTYQKRPGSPARHRPGGRPSWWP